MIEPPELSDWFWSVVEDERPIEELFGEMTDEELLRFHYELEDATCEIRDEPFSEYMTKDSEDGVIDIGYWAVSQGRDYYTRIFAHPEELPYSVEQYPVSRLHDGITLTAYYARTGEYPAYRED